jgi:predicted GNAT family acetyltransferase
MRLLWMRHAIPPPHAPPIAVEHVPYDAVNELRDAWHHEDYPGQDPTAYNAEARQVALRRDVQVLAVREGGRPIAFAQLEREATAAEITQVYVHHDDRGRGRGTAMTRAVIEAADGVQDLWDRRRRRGPPEADLRPTRLPPGVDDDGMHPAALNEGEPREPAAERRP